jgi:threonine/homoserine/homoserine lactone efflux protein
VGADYLGHVPSTQMLIAFSIASVLILLVPGPAVVFVISRGISQGSRGALMSVAGLHAGSLVHVIAAAAGLSALLVRSATAFSVVKYAGAAYLMYLGVRTLRSQTTIPRTLELPPVSLKRSLREGFIVNLLNPKLALFFLAVLPQFVRPENDSILVQILSLGILFVVLGLLTDSAYALGAARLGSWLQTRPMLANRQRTFAGLSYLGLGALAALSPRPSTLK